MQVLIFNIGDKLLMCPVEHINSIIELNNDSISRQSIMYYRDRPIGVVRGWSALSLDQPSEKYMLIMVAGASKFGVTISGVETTEVIDDSQLQQVAGQQVALVGDRLITLVTPRHFGGEHL